MRYGLRTNGYASLRLAIPTALPADMRQQVVELRDLRTRKDKRRQGEAQSLMEGVTAEADLQKFFLMLICEPEEGCGIDRDQLAQFYDRHGFVAIQAEPVLLMVRPVAGVREG